MPHSVTPEAREPDEEPMATDVEASQDASEHEEDDQDHDMAMIETIGEAAATVEKSAPAVDVEKQEVKLEDLFADVESDEEFPSSNAQDVKMSSSPEAPASPMSVPNSVLLSPSKLTHPLEIFVLLQDLLIQK
jgi:DNA primase small subunit